MISIFLGPPGVGKGTQSQALCKKKNWCLLVMGDILRQAVREESEHGNEAGVYMKAGKLVPDRIIIDAISPAIDACKDRFILDGFPRTISQAKALDEHLRKKKSSINRVIYLTAPDDVLIERLSSRRTCSNCNRVYNLVTDPPRVEDVCNFCERKLMIRNDDRPEIVKHRLHIYHTETSPLIEYYTKSNLLSEVDGIGPIEEVQKRILEVLN